MAEKEILSRKRGWASVIRHRPASRKHKKYPRSYAVGKPDRVSERDIEARIKRWQGSLCQGGQDRS